MREMRAEFSLRSGDDRGVLAVRALRSLRHKSGASRREDRAPAAASLPMKFSRRTFSAGAASLTAPIAAPARAGESFDRDVVIIGAGAAAFGAARELRRA